MKKTYIVKAKSYADAIKKVKKIKKDGDLSWSDEKNLKECLKLMNSVKFALGQVEAPINETRMQCNKLIKMIKDDLAYEQIEGIKDACDEYKIVKRAGAYIIKYGNKDVAEYEELADAKRNLKALKMGKAMNG